MQEVHHPALDYLQFPGLAMHAEVVHGFSLRRQGGEDCNMGYSVGKAHGDAGMGRRRFTEALGLDLALLTVGGQVHGDRVALVRPEEAGRGAHGPESVLPATDGLICASPGVALLVTAADCPTLFLLDPAVPAIGLVHSGWRGTLAGIGPKAVMRMATTFGSKPRDLRVGVGPGIGPCCYEIGPEVLEKLPALGGDFLLPGNQPQRAFLGLQAWIRAQLLEAGVGEGNLEFSGRCTACDTTRFFSHRAERGRTGRSGALLALRT